MVTLGLYNPPVNNCFMDLLIWTCQGSASKGFLRVIMDLLRVHRPRILALLEPRISGDQTNGICRKVGFDNWVQVEAVGFSDGIWIFWMDGYMVDILFTHPQFIALKVCYGGSEPWFLTVVYGSPNAALRKRLWEDLVPDKLGMKGAWLRVGDFNVVATAEEVSTQGPLATNRRARFQEWIYDHGLLDLGFIGPQLTWIRGLHSGTFKGARLDRALCSLEWRDRFSNALVRISLE